jgi:hypothetical protein
LWQPDGLENNQFRAHISGMVEASPDIPPNPSEFVNGRRITGYGWGWMVDIQRIRLAKFPGNPMITRRRFDTLELAREEALRLGPIKEIDESEYASQTP